jgi:DNA-binding NtrC family response regulator
LILGEKGTSREGLARALHGHSDRSTGEFVHFDCSKSGTQSISEEIFGKRFGNETRIKGGLIKRANKGTLFLDNVSALPLGTQAKLVRLHRRKDPLQNNQENSIGADIRLICADDTDLGTKIKRYQFSADLYYFFSILFKIPPLRSRLEDIPELVEHFLRRRTVSLKNKKPLITSTALTLLERYWWPENDSELYEVLESALVCSGDQTIAVHHLPAKLLRVVSRIDRSEDGEGYSYML